LGACRSVEHYDRLNEIEEGSYGVVFRARDTQTGDVVAVKKLKFDRAQRGFPITSLREIATLKAIRHDHVVALREIVVGHSPSQIYIVMDFVEHDLKTLMGDMREPFLQSEVKTLLLQLLSATAHMHERWILHRDLKTSNLLMNNRGQIKVADFGLARYFTEPLPPLTQLVVTLWYRAPELLLGAREYSTAVDMWSIGCIFGELLTNKPLLEGKSEIDQIAKIFALIGFPSKADYPGFAALPNAASVSTPTNQRYTGSAVRTTFPLLTAAGADLLGRLLHWDPAKRISARAALAHPYFSEDPRPKAADMFPTFPSRNTEDRRARASPRAP
ncbi:kinase-like domain-containing protein, partial [Dipodascopsis tothii]|uniref:kinase-like domain-containing protein n=1 Tax=Dipodascopsis tothii TaxID=44089 RepID=UPI0034CF7D22